MKEDMAGAEKKAKKYCCEMCGSVVWVSARHVEEADVFCCGRPMPVVEVDVPDLEAVEMTV